MDYKKLTADLIAATIAAKRYCTVEDGGTCNFDTCVLLAKNLNFKTLEAAVAKAGLMVSKWDAGVYHIYGYEYGQGNRRTTMVEAFTKTLETLGYNVSIHYAMD